MTLREFQDRMEKQVNLDLDAQIFILGVDAHYYKLKMLYVNSDGTIILDAGPCVEE